MRICVTGAAGFIGHHLVRYLFSQHQDTEIIGFDIAEEFIGGEQWYLTPWPAWLGRRDLREYGEAKWCLGYGDVVYALAADMGGIGYITNPSIQLAILTNNLTINLNTLKAAVAAGVKRVLFTSSVCVYPVHRLASLRPQMLRERDAMPANPQDSYGWEKLMSEMLYKLYETKELETRIVRLENTYGPECQWRGGREKAVAALCRKVAIAKLTDSTDLEIWGDGEQRRTFMHIDDCVRGLVTVMESDCEEPVNLGPDESVSIDELADLIMEAAGVDLRKLYVEGPQGVRGRNFSHERAKSLGWEAKVPLKEGIAETYRWIEGEVEKWLSEKTSRPSSPDS